MTDSSTDSRIPNTLFLIAKRDVLKGNNYLESGMWELSDEERELPTYLSLQKSKTTRSVKGGRILGFRLATKRELEFHQDMIKAEGEPDKFMKRIENRYIIEFEPIKDMVGKLRDTQSKSKQHGMAYKGLGWIDPASLKT